MSITQIIVEYLETNRRITVGGLGTFIKKQGGTEIVFSEFIKDDDGVLRSLLIESGLKELEAVAVVDRFIFDLKYALMTEGRDIYVMSGLGRMTFVGGMLSFEYDPNITAQTEPTEQPAKVVEPELVPEPTPEPKIVVAEPTVAKPVVEPVAKPAAEPIAVKPESDKVVVEEEPVVADSNLFDSFANYAGEGQNLDLKESFNKWWIIIPIIAVVFVLIALFYWIAVEWMYGNMELPGFLDSLFGSIFLNESGVPGAVPPVE